jgi:hypothetical protein
MLPEFSFEKQLVWWERFSLPCGERRVNHMDLCGQLVAVATAAAYI